MRSYRLGAVMLVVMFTLGLLVTQPALAEEPVVGGILRVAIAGDPPTLDMHQEQTFKVVIPMSTVYNTLVRFDPHGFPKIIGDLAESWTVSEDHKTYTFKVYQGVKFHDGGEMTAEDVVASFEKIMTVTCRFSLCLYVTSTSSDDVPDHTIASRRYKQKGGA